MNERRVTQSMPNLGEASNLSQKKDWLLGAKISGIALIAGAAVAATIGTAAENGGRPNYLGRDSYTYGSEPDRDVCSIVADIAQANDFDSEEITSNCAEVESRLTHLSDGTEVTVEIAQHPNTNDFDVIALPDKSKR